MSKVIVTAVAIVAGLLSVSASAVESGAVTRAQVKAELEALQAVGYQLTGEDPTYPAKLQAARMKIRASAMTSETESGYGCPVSNTSSIGIAAPIRARAAGGCASS